MTIIDDVWEFSDAQDIGSGTLSNGSYVLSEDVVDLAATQKDGFGTTVTTTRLGEQAKPLALVCTVNTAFTGASAAVIVSLRSNASTATLTSAHTNHGSVTIPALSAAGTQVVLPLPWASYARYLGVLYTASGGNLSAGKVDCHIVEAGELTD